VTTDLSQEAEVRHFFYKIAKAERSRLGKSNADAGRKKTAQPCLPQGGGNEARKEALEPFEIFLRDDNKTLLTGRSVPNSENSHYLKYLRTGSHSHSRPQLHKTHFPLRKGQEKEEKGHWAGHLRGLGTEKKETRRH